MRAVTLSPVLDPELLSRVAAPAWGRMGTSRDCVAAPDTERGTMTNDPLAPVIAARATEAREARAAREHAACTHEPAVGEVCAICGRGPRTAADALADQRADGAVARLRATADAAHHTARVAAGCGNATDGPLPAPETHAPAAADDAPDEPWEDRTRGIVIGVAFTRREARAFLAADTPTRPDRSRPSRALQSAHATIRAALTAALDTPRQETNQ